MRKPTLYVLSLFSFMLGLMAKPMLISLPVVMLLMDYWPLSRGYLREHNLGRLQPQKRVSLLTALLKEKIPFFACSLLSAAVTIYAHRAGEAITNFDLVPLGLRIENAVIAYVTYFTKTLWPHDLAILYPYPSSFPLWQVICSFLILVLVSASTIWAGRRHPYLAVGWFWFLVSLVPVIGLVQVGAQSMADRYTYIPLIGLFIMVAWGVPALTKNLQYRKTILALLSAAVIMVSAAITWQQLGYWRDSISIFRHALQVTSNNSLAHNNVGAVLYKKGDVDAAIKEYQAALMISPNFFESHFNLGLALFRKGNMDEAIKEYREALKINPNDVETHYNLGVALGRKGDLDEAIKEYREALKINPNFVLAQRNLGASLSRGGFDKVRK
jgi:tetratricopeptide (TPR) repeat protein